MQLSSSERRKLRPKLHVVYYKYGRIKHLVGQPGTKGGKKTACGRYIRALDTYGAWYSRYSANPRITEGWYACSLSVICKKCRAAQL